MYKAIEVLQHQNATLDNSVTLKNGVQLALWRNQHALVNFENTQHHTFSMYVQDGYESYHKRSNGWFNGGEPGRFCLLPKESISTWDIRGNLKFLHFYCNDEHLIQLAESTWDKSPQSILLDERVFIDDPSLQMLYQHFLLQANWNDPASQMMQSTASSMVMLHLLQHYTNIHWKPLQIRGGLAPYQLNQMKEYIQSHLDQPLSLEMLAAQINLSEYHFARMFKTSTGLSPHQYVMQQRIEFAAHQLKHTQLSMIDIAIRCGFHSASHFAQQFKARYGITPSAYRLKKQV